MLGDSVIEKRADKASISSANMESITSDESMGKKEGEGLDSRCCIHVHSIRKRLADPDGVSAKAAIDGLVRAGLLKDDSAKYVKAVTYSQSKCKGDESEKTILQVTYG